MTTPTSPWNLPLFGTGDAVAPLEANFNLISNGLNASLSSIFATPADLSALAAVTGMQNGSIALVTEGGATFRYIGTTWTQITTAFFGSASARTSAYIKASSAYLVQGVKSKRVDSTVEETYWSAYNSSTNPTSPALAAGWVSVTPSARFKGSITTSTTIASSQKLGISAAPFQVTDDPQAGFAASTGLYTCQVGGTYLVMVAIKNNTTGVANQAIIVAKNGATVYLTGNITTSAYGGVQASCYFRLLPGDTVSAAPGTAYVSQSDAPADNNFFELVQVAY
jgi:hypothetical protein